MGSGKVLPHGRVQNLEESGASQLNIASSDVFDYTRRPYCPHFKNLKRFLHSFRSRLTQGACQGSNALAGLLKKVSKSEVSLTFFSQLCK